VRYISASYITELAAQLSCNTTVSNRVPKCKMTRGKDFLKLDQGTGNIYRDDVYSKVKFEGRARIQGTLSGPEDVGGSWGRWFSRALRSDKFLLCKFQRTTGRAGCM
jgi:hypothetical protein